MAKSKHFRTTIGGQALIEGIMMRGPQKTASVARMQDGKMAFREEENRPLKDRHPVLGWILIRGAVNFVSSLRAGFAALTWSSEFYPEAETEKEPSKLSKWLEGHHMEGFVSGVAAVLALILGLGLFTLLPALVCGWLGMESGPWRNVAETGFRLAVVLLYMVLVSRMKDIQRTFAYHGAEHKTIACYEAGGDLTVENVKKFSRFHPRCGTSFLLMVVLVGMLIFFLASSLLPFLPWENAFLRAAFRLALLPLVVSVSYEVNRLVGKYDTVLTKLLRAPGLAMQKLTTREPDAGMIEVGIEALRRVIPREEGGDEWGRE